MRRSPLTACPLAIGLLALFVHGPAVAGDCRQRPMGEYDAATFVGSEACAACHPQHYDEWQGSAHAYAVTDPVFWAGNEESFATNGIENFCITCHSPIADVTNATPTSHATAVTDLIPQAQGGVGCESCHRIFDVTGGIETLTGCEDYYFGPIADPVDSPHGAELSDAFGSAAFCAPCHNVNISHEDIGLLTIEFTNFEWDAANTAAGGTAEEPAIATCQECHMPAYTGVAAVDGPEREVHSHQMAGVDAALVPFADSHRQYRAGQDLVRSAATIEVSADPSGALVEVENLIIGHDLPTGSAHARAVWVHLQVVDAEGNVLLESGDTDANGDLRDANSEHDPYGDPWITSGEAVFRQYMYDAEGAEVVAAYGDVVTVEREMLGSGELRTIGYTLDLPADTAYPVEVTADLLFRPASNFILRELGMPDEQIALVPTYTIASSATTIEAGR